MRDRVDVMVDLETLSVESNTQLLQVSALAFDIDNGQELFTFDHVIDISHEKAMQVSGSTLAWWLKTDKDLMATLVQRGIEGGEDEATVLKQFSLFFETLKKIYPGVPIYLWGNGINFDNRILREKMDPYPISYQNDRDVRTLVDIYCTISGKDYYHYLKPKFLAGKTAHNALDDCRAQAEMVVFCLDYCKILEETC